MDPSNSNTNNVIDVSYSNSTQAKPVQVTLVETSGNPSGLQLVNPYQTNKVSDPTDLVELARQVQKADEFVRGTAINKLSVIVDQIRYLQQQARKVLEESHRDNLLHHVACNFKKVPGKIYYLYERPSGQKYFSMLSPNEWGTTCPHKYLGSYRLEADMSWTPAEKVPERTEELALLEKIMQAQKAMTETGVLNISGPLPLSLPPAENPPSSTSEKGKEEK